MGGLPRPPCPLGASRLTTVRWRVEAQAPDTGEADATVWLVRPAGEAAARMLARAPPTAADLADAAQWEGAERGAARLRRRLLLRGLVAEVLGVVVDAVALERDPGGRPRVVAPRTAFCSVARRGEWAALAMAMQPVGVDLEAVNAPPNWSLLPASSAAAADGDPSAPRLTFPAAWAACEAYLKAGGEGLGGIGALTLGWRDGVLTIDGPRGAACAHLMRVDEVQAAAVLL